MDKKQTLTPELQKIYENVMNTPVKSTAAVPTQILAPKLPVVATPSQTPIVASVKPITPVSTSAAVSPSAPTSSSASQGFVFTSTAASVPPSAVAQAGTATVATLPKKGHASAKLFIFAGITFMVFYFVFWLKYFKYF